MVAEDNERAFNARSMSANRLILERTEPAKLATGERFAGLRLAVLIPCYNEAAAIAQVVGAFRAALPEARILVFDNNSSDDTVAIAKKAGAETRHVPQQGKGNV